MYITILHTFTYTYWCLLLYYSTIWRACGRGLGTASLRTKILDRPVDEIWNLFKYVWPISALRFWISEGFDSNRILILRGGTPRPMGNYPGDFESTSLSGDSLSREMGGDDGGRAARALRLGRRGVKRYTVSFHNLKSQKFKLSVSNPKNKYVAYVSELSQGLGRKNKH